MKISRVFGTELAFSALFNRRAKLVSFKLYKPSCCYAKI